ATWQAMIGVWVKWIDFPPLAMVCLRCVFAALALWLIVPRGTSALSTLLRGGGATGPADRLTLFSGGALMAGHWGTLFIAYRIAEIDPVVIAVLTYPIVAALLEPVGKGARPQFRHVGSAVVACLGVAFVRSGDLSESSLDGAGVALGLISGLCFALR